MEQTGNNNHLNLISVIWDGTLTGKNLLPLREQILSCNSAIPSSGSKLYPMSHMVYSIPFHSTPFHSRFNVMPLQTRFGKFNSALKTI